MQTPTRPHTPGPLVLLLLLAGIAAGCTPPVAPVYRDFAPRAGAHAEGELRSRLLRALAGSGWQEAPTADPRVLATVPRRIAGGAFGASEASLVVTPLSEEFVRVQAVVVRRGLFGGRSRMPYLTPGQRRAALGPVTDALAAEGFVAVGTPEERDQRRRVRAGTREDVAESAPPAHR